MKDMTQGSISRHLFAMAMPMLVGMLLQTLYYVVDLYFVAQLGEAAIAGVGAAGNAILAVFALTQMLGVGVVALISQAVGRKDRPAANLAFNQALLMSLALAGLTLLLGIALVGRYMSGLSSDAATQVAGRTFFLAILPGVALQFPMVAMGSALRGTGVVKPTMIISSLTLLLNTALAPVLTAGWGTGRPLGVFGAGLASTISVGVGLILLIVYFIKLEKYVAAQRSLLAPRWALWGEMWKIGLPAGGEFALMSLYFAVIYYCLNGLGPVAQAGFSIGSRVMQSITIPALVVAFAAAPIVGQNFGARLPDRVRATFTTAAWVSALLGLILTVVCRWWPEALVGVLTNDRPVIAFAAEFLSTVALNFVGSGLVFACSSVFQGLGNTWPALASSATRLLTFAIPGLWMSGQPWFTARHLWWLSVATVAGQALLSLWLVRRELQRKLNFTTSPALAPT